MAYQTRSRDPFLDSTMQAAIEKRGKELIGIALICIGLLLAAIFASYTPDDPNWIVSTDGPVNNWLGRPGASIAASLFMVLGLGSWGFALAFLVWGVRFAAHRGEERIIRFVFVPIAVFLLSFYTATLVPDAAWRAAHNAGLGGFFGDMGIKFFLSFVPVGSHLGIKLMSLIMAISVISLGTYALGFTRRDIQRGLRVSLIGVILVYSGAMNLLGRGAVSAVNAARQNRENRVERQEIARQAHEAELAVELAAEPTVAPVEPQIIADLVAADPVADERSSFLSRMPSLIRRPDPVPDYLPEDMPEPELVEPQPVAGFDVMPGSERIRAKIADAIKTRSQQAADLIPEPDLSLTKGRGRKPDPLVLDVTLPATELPPEPTLVAMPQTTLPPEPPVMATTALPLVEPVIAPPLPVAEPRKVVQNPIRKAPIPSRRAKAEAEPTLAFEDPTNGFELPPLNLLSSAVDVQHQHLSDDALAENARMLESVLDDYGVKGEIVSVRPGPVITMYELEPAPGLKASRVIGLADDIARSMAALSARVSTVPGRSVIGIELPNEHREKVALREILSSREFGDSHMKLPLALGKDIAGEPMVTDLSKMPHLLIAGTTGSGKSVAINTMILSLLYKLTPAECRLIMIDPKMLELSVYDGIPHLLSPVVTDPKKAVVALKWTVGEMEDRYRKMSKMGVRNIDGYNSRVKEALAKDEMFSRTVQTGFDDDTGEPMFETEEFAPETLPYIVVVVDEMADLMMVAGKEIEACIQRLAQMARASGIHLIMATQRPSVDVITGTIKANFPTRISFQVTSKIDSRTILGEMGAEQLLGMGDMLFMAGGAKIVRCHGPFVSDEEVEEIVTHLKAFGPPKYVSHVLSGPDEGRGSDIDLVLGLGGNTNGEDALYDTAVQIVIKDRKCSTSYIQRKLAIGYNKAARLVERMEDEQLVSPANHVGKRDILVPEQH